MGSSCTTQRLPTDGLHYLTFSPEHHKDIVLSEDRRTAKWKSLENVTGCCFSNRKILNNEKVRIKLHGTGYVDVGLTSVNPFNEGYPDFKYLFGRVLYLDPCEIEFQITGNSVEVKENGKVKPQKVNIGRKDHWLMLQLGCGEIEINLL